jgi:molybdopterin/thiamine biosynthesis adenylyltransferase
MVCNNILIVGLGGLGAPAADTVVRRGAKRLTLIDPDPVELSNLARQVIYSTEDIGIAKVEAAASYLQRLNPSVEVNAIIGRLDEFNADSIIEDAGFVIDATDDPQTKFLINDVCVSRRVPFIYGGVLGYSGQAMTVIPGLSACLRCLFEQPPDPDEVASCRDAGIIGPVAGLIGVMQGLEAIRWVDGDKPELIGTILTYDAKIQSRMRQTIVNPRPGCACGAVSSHLQSSDEKRTE